MSVPNQDPNTWLENLNPASVQLWREAMTHLRELNREVWRCFTLFFAVNAFLLLVVWWLAGRNDAELITLVILLSGSGLALIGNYVLKRQRIYYLQMLLKKSLLEDECGFYAVKFSDSQTDLAFPWRVTPEAVAEMKKAPDQWIDRQIRGHGTIAFWLFVINYAVFGVYALALILTLRTYF